jgi:hypothetical protein
MGGGIMITSDQLECQRAEGNRVDEAIDDAHVIFFLLHLFRSINGIH